MNIKIGKAEIGDGSPLYFIADIAANHDGDIGRAFRLIELAKKSGADAVKFQNFQAEKIVSRRGFESLGSQLSHQASWQKSVYEVYQDASIPFEWAIKLKEKCDEIEIEYMSSPYDFESVDLVEPYVNVYKIGSGEITWLEILQYIANKHKPVILSSGASSLPEVKRAMKTLLSITKEIVLMQCNTNYTAATDNYNHINLNVLKNYKKIFPNVVLGLSDHTYGCSTVLGAVALGARVFEKHFTDDNNRVGPDHKFSMTAKSWREMVDRADELYRALGDGEKKVEENEKDTVIVQRRALRFTRDLPQGHILKEGDLFPLRPAPINSIPPYEIKKIIGRKLIRNVSADDYIFREDVV